MRQLVISFSLAALLAGCVTAQEQQAQEQRQQIKTAVDNCIQKENTIFERMRCQKEAEIRIAGQEQPYSQDIRRQLGYYRAERLRELCKKLPTPAIGMKAAQVSASCWGQPDNVAESATAQGKAAVWGYPEGYVYIADGVVIRIVTSR
jgi:hypothetical protein